MGWLSDFLQGAGKLGEDRMLPEWDGRSDGTGIRGKLERIGDGILDMDIDMSERAIDRGALQQLRDSKTISNKEYNRLMNRLR